MTERHPALDPERIEALREEMDLKERPVSPDANENPAPGPAGASASAKAAAKAAIRKGIAWYVDPVARDNADQAADRVGWRVDQLAREVDQLGDEADALRTLTVNLELLKAEVRSLLGRLEDLGMAIAPATGLEGAGVRMAELRERLNDLDRRFRRAQTSLPPGPPPSAATPGAGVPPTASGGPTPATVGSAPSSALFDYVSFERRFRGDPESVSEAVKERYLEVLVGHGPVLDVGCGRGELLTALTAEGVACKGVDLDPNMVAHATERGLEVSHGDALAHLRAQPENSLGAIVAIHVLEHLPLDALLELLELSLSRLEPGGLLVAETPNPASLIVLGNSYILDPTHVWPLHPSLLAFLCENAGFRDVRLDFYAPAEAHQLALIDAPDAPAWVDQINEAFRRLNHDLFGPQDYSVTATTPPTDAPSP